MNVPEEWSPLRKEDRTRLTGHLTLTNYGMEPLSF